MRAKGKKEGGTFRKVGTVKTVGETMRRAAELEGPVVLCRPCFAWSYSWHVCPDWSDGPWNAKPTYTAVVTLAGGLEAEADTLEPATELEPAEA